MSTWLLRLHAHDERMLHALVLRRRRAVDVVMRTVTHLGDATTTVGIVVFLLSGVAPELRWAGRHAMIALVASHLGVQLLKRSMKRTRPKLPVGYDSLVRAPDRFSFPSGHSAAAVAVAIPLAFALPPIAGCVLAGFAVLAGVSRCYLGVHYPGDVVVGWLLGLLGLALAFVVL